jgi:two-component system, NarL family, capsular synthesis sensor histidine kinase RcsC
MTMSEPVNYKSPTGQQDISALERHQRRLLFGGGVFLTVIILLIMSASILLSINDYKSDKFDGFRKAKVSVDALFARRNDGYMRTLKTIEYAWKNKADDLDAKGSEYLEGFLANGDETVIQAGQHGLPLVVLGRHISKWPAEKTARYLGLMRELSAIGGTTVPADGDPVKSVASFYDPNEMLLAFVTDAKATGLEAISENRDRAGLFDKVIKPNANVADMATLKNLGHGNKPGLTTSFDKNPLTGEPAILGSLIAMDEGEPIGALVAYEPTQPFVEWIREDTNVPLTVVTDDGKVVIGTGSDNYNEGVAHAITPYLVLKRAGGLASYRVHGKFFITERVKDTPWTLVLAYTWQDLLHAELASIIASIVLAVMLLSVLWLLLIRQDRGVFSPLLSRAKRVYQSEVLNRTMIETSPVGLCVIAVDNAAPLLQNDLVRGYAAGIPDPGATFYRQLLQGFSESKDMLDGRPDTREFNLSLQNGFEEGVRHLLVSAMPIFYQDRNALFCVLRDVTARTEIEESLRRAKHDSELARLEAESASRAKTSFVAMMSHEIRTPLNGILGHLELLGRAHLEPAQRERLERVRISADALLAVISDVLDFSRIEAGQLDIDPVPFELRPLIEQTVLLYAPAVHRKGLKIYYSVESGLGASYVADAHRIRQVLNNLVSNAVKFTESGRIVLRVRCAPVGTEAEARLRFEVIDSGIGMTEQQLQQVFQPFSQADASISRRFGGSGLGLTLCHQISELMGGKIEAHSTLGVGSMFALEVPVVIDELIGTASQKALQNYRIALLSGTLEWRNEISSWLTGLGADVMTGALPSELDMEWVKQSDALILFGTWHAWSDDEEQSLSVYAKRVVKAVPDGPLLPELRDGLRFVSCYSSKALLAAILDVESGSSEHAGYFRRKGEVRHTDRTRLPVMLVDDNAVNRELIQQQLEALGYAVDTAEDGVAALRLWQDGRYEMVLTDINMPNMDGYELTQQLRQQGAMMPILAVTATALASEKAHCKEAGIDDLLLKPLSLERLGEAMERHLNRAAPAPASPVKPAWAGRYHEKVARIFVESGTRDLQAILDAANAREQESLLARIHSMKGALLMLGEKDVAAQCTSLEKQVEAEGILAALSGVGRLERAMRDLLQCYAASF